MKSLSSYIKDNTKMFTVDGTSSDKMLIFDVDDTLIHTTANIWVVKNNLPIKKLSNAEFNDYVLKRGERFDFREFDDPDILKNERFTKYWNTLKREYKKGTHISILTARGNSDMLHKFFLNNGIDIKPSLIFAIGDPKMNITGTVQERKAIIIKHIVKNLGYSTMVFFDDNEGNLKEAKKLEETLNIKIYTVKA